MPRNRTPVLPGAARRSGRRRTWVAVMLASCLLISGSRGSARAADSAGSPLEPLSSNAPVPSATAVATALEAPLDSAALGSGLVGEVVDARSDQVLWARSADRAVSPASATKLLTAAAALSVLGPADRPVTTVLTAGPLSAGVLDGDLVLRGGGDVLLGARTTSAWPERADLDALATRVRQAGITRVSGHLVADGSLFTGPRLAGDWSASYVTQGSIAPVTGLGVDEGGRAVDHGNRSADPPLATADAFRAALARVGIAVGPGTTAGITPPDARVLATVAGPTVAASVEEMLANSDNDAAEALGRRIALKQGLPATFTGAARAVSDATRSLGVPVTGLELFDASGLSHSDRLAPVTLIALLRVAATGDGPLAALRPLVSGLAVAGFDGTLDARYRTGPAASGGGFVRAKTGALLGVTSLTGTVTDIQGRLLLFSFVTDSARSRSGAEGAVDRAAAALAGL